MSVTRCLGLFAARILFVDPLLTSPVLLGGRGFDPDVDCRAHPGHSVILLSSSYYLTPNSSLFSKFLSAASAQFNTNNKESFATTNSSAAAAGLLSATTSSAELTYAVVPASNPEPSLKYIWN